MLNRLAYPPELTGHVEWTFAVVRTPVDDAEALALECIRLIKDDALRQRLATSARTAALNYSSEVMASRLVKLYDQITSSRTKHS